MGRKAAVTNLRDIYRTQVSLYCDGRDREEALAEAANLSAESSAATSGVQLAADTGSEPSACALLLFAWCGHHLFMNWDASGSVSSWVTALIVLVTAMLAIMQWRSQQKMELVRMLYHFADDLYQNKAVRDMFLDIEDGDKPLHLERRDRRTALAQLLDCLSTAGVLVAKTKLSVRDIERSGIAYVVVVTSNHLDVAHYLADTAKRHRDNNLPDEGFGGFRLLASKLSEPRSPRRNAGH